MIALLDTSTDTAVFALMDDENILFQAEKTGRFGASVILPKMIEAAREKGYEIRNTKQWLVGKGPGSFTGTRVGIAFAHGISTGLGTLMKGSNSGYVFLAKALKVKPSIKSCAILHDGRRDEVIINGFELINDQWIAKEIFICKITEIVEKAAAYEQLISPMPAEKLKESTAGILCDIKPAIEGLRLDHTAHPTNPSEEALSLQPIYVRPAVFIAPLKTRDI